MIRRLFAIAALAALLPAGAFATCPNAETRNCIKDDSVVLDGGQTLDEAIASGGLGGDNLGSDATRGVLTITGGNAAFAPGAILDSFHGTSNPSPTGGTPQCDDDELYLNRSTNQLYYCADGATDTWRLVSPIAEDTNAVTDLSTPCDFVGQMHKQTNATINDLAICIDPATDDWEFYSSKPFIFFRGAIEELTSGAGVVATQDQYAFRTPAGGSYTLSAVRCITPGANTIPLTFQECNGTGGSCVDTHTAISCSSTGASATITDTTIAANVWTKIELGTPSGTAVPNITWQVLLTRN